PADGLPADPADREPEEEEDDGADGGLPRHSSARAVAPLRPGGFRLSRRGLGRRGGVLRHGLVLRQLRRRVPGTVRGVLLALGGHRLNYVPSTNIMQTMDVKHICTHCRAPTAGAEALLPASHTRRALSVRKVSL